MKSNKLYFLLLILVGIYASTYIVPEGEMGVLYRFGTLVKKPNKQLALFSPGIHFAIPLLNSIRHIDLDMQTTSWRSAPFPITQQKYVQLDYYLEWNINNLNLYLDNKHANSFPDAIRKEFESSLQTACTNLNMAAIATGQKQIILSILQNNLLAKAKATGINISNAGITNIYDPDVINNAMLENQQKEYAQLAAQYKQNNGETAAKEIRDKTNLTVTTIIAEAQLKAAQIRAEASQQAANIYNNAYTQDPEFYLWQRSLATYKKNFTSGTSILVLQPGGTFLQYLKHNTKTTLEPPKATPKISNHKKP